MSLPLVFEGRGHGLGLESSQRSLPMRANADGSESLDSISSLELSYGTCCTERQRRVPHIPCRVEQRALARAADSVLAHCIPCEDTP
jgi:hypothetical protein